jgi:hypothetical protein
MKFAVVAAIVRAIGAGLGAAICPDNSSLYKLFSPPKMSDKLPACRCLPESPFAGSLDKLEDCRTLRGALLILCGAPRPA